MANSGKDTNGSQFFITTAVTNWLDGKHVVFGKVISGQQVVQKMEKQGTQDGTPKSSVVIVDCGQKLVEQKGDLLFFDIGVNGKSIGKITFKLYEETPLTAANFRALCTGQNDLGLSYKNTKFHKVITGSYCQGGDVVKGDGTGGTSIYGTTFKDENYRKKHSKLGILSMANTGKNTNNSQFIITSAACDWLDGKQVVFGEVVDGLNIVRQLDKLGSENGAVSSEVKILDCGAI
jgi:peptidylprolyl isomerase